MAYIGREPVNGFHAKQTLSTDGSTVTFTLDFSVADETAIIVSVGGVLQEPKVAYNLAAGGTQITFTAAPAATDTAYIHYLGQAIVQNLVDLNGVALVLDADADTTIAADTDDQIDIQIAGADDFQFTANKFSVLTGSSQSFADSAKGLFGTGDDLEIYHDGTNSLIANKTGALKIATETSGIAVTIGHTTSETTVADNLTVTGNLTVGGTTSFGDFDITNVGSIALDTITNDGTDITLDSSADIVIDAAGGNIEFKDAGTLQLTLDMDGTAGAQVIQLGVDSDDLIFKQYDGTTVLTLDDDTTVKVAANLTVGGTVTSTGAITGSSTVQGTTITATTAFVPDAANGAALGTTSLEFSALYLHESSPIYFGADQDVVLAHVPDAGLSLKTASTADDTKATLTLQTGDTDIAANDVLGQLHFQAPDEGAGTDAILVAAGIAAISEGDFSASNNATKLSFQTGASEAASEKMSLSSAGILTVADDIIIGDGKTIGSASDPDAITIASNGQLTLTQTLIGTALDISGDIDVDGTTNLDVVDIDGAVDMASTLQVDGNLTTSGVNTFTVTDNSDNLTLKSTDTDADVGPNLRLYRAVAGADNDAIGTIDWTAQDESGNLTEYASIKTVILDASDGTEDAKIEHKIMNAGALNQMLTISGAETVINEGSKDHDFRVESNGNTHQLFVDGGNDKVYVGAGSGSSIGSNRFQVQNGGATISSFANDSGSSQLHFIKSRNTTVGSQTIVNDGDAVGGIFWKADDGNATDYNNNVAGIEGVIDGTPGTDDTPGRLVFYTTADGARTNTERMRIDSAGNVGIGNNNPGTKLSVGDDDAGSIGTTGKIFTLSQDGSTTFNAGNVGTIFGMNIMNNDETSNRTGSGITFGHRSSSSGIGYIVSTSTAADRADLRFGTRGSDGINQRMHIETEGQVGIGQDAGDSKVEITQATAGDHYPLFLKHSAGSGVVRILRGQFTAFAPDDNTSRFATFGDSDATRLDIHADGDVKNHDNSYGSISDERIKSNITDANSQWDDIKALKVRNFERKDDITQYGAGQKVQIGVVAQEVESVSPGLVKDRDPTEDDIKMSSEFGALYTSADNETKDGNDAVLYTQDEVNADVYPEGHPDAGDRISTFSVGDIKIPATHSKKVGDIKSVTGEKVKGVSYSVLYMKAIKALQEAQTRIETLESKVQALEDA